MTNEQSPESAQWSETALDAYNKLAVRGATRRVMPTPRPRSAGVQGCGV